MCVLNKENRMRTTLEKEWALSVGNSWSISDIHFFYLQPYLWVCRNVEGKKFTALIFLVSKIHTGSILECESREQKDVSLCQFVMINLSTRFVYIMI